MSKKQDEILDAISKLTVIELSELIKAMEEKFDVSASAAVAVALTVATTNGGWAGLVQMLSTMTYWSNILLIFVGFALVLNPQRDGRIFRWLRLSSLVMITVVGIIFPLALAAKADTTGLYAFSCPTLHYFMPWASLLGFVLFGPRPRFTWGTYWSMTILPLLYSWFLALALQRPWHLQRP